MIFVWLALTVGIAVLAALIEAVATEAREEHDMAVASRGRMFRRPTK